MFFSLKVIAFVTYILIGRVKFYVCFLLYQGKHDKAHQFDFFFHLSIRCLFKNCFLYYSFRMLTRKNLTNCQQMSVSSQSLRKLGNLVFQM